MISRPENIFNYTLSRRDLLKFTAASVASAAASTFEPLTATLGQPEKTAPGSKFYGYHMNTYIYASKGIVFIGNPNINEVFEIQSFTPMSVEEYINNYGQDISESQRRGEGP